MICFWFVIHSPLILKDKWRNLNSSYIEEQRLSNIQGGDIEDPDYLNDEIESLTSQ